MSDTRPEDRGEHGGAGSEGTIPDAPDGVAAGVTEEKNTFEPEEDPDVTGVDE
jgi:hypothetical protein